MSRPESINDIPAEEKRVKILGVKFETLGVRPSLAKITAEFLQAATNLDGVELVNSYNETQVYAQMTLGEQRELLRTQQSQWDYQLGQYNKVISGEEMREYILKGVQSWAADNNLEDPVVRRDQLRAEAEANERIAEDELATLRAKLSES